MNKLNTMGVMFCVVMGLVMLGTELWAEEKGLTFYVPFEEGASAVVAGEDPNPLTRSIRSLPSPKRCSASSSHEHLSQYSEDLRQHEKEDITRNTGTTEENERWLLLSPSRARGRNTGVLELRREDT